MEYVTLGRTGLRVSVAGLGCGGFSRLGLGTGKSEAEAVALVRQAVDLGVNLLDTASVYGTEAVVGQAIKTIPRDNVVIATKAWIPRREGRSAAERAVASLDSSLKQLGTDHVDIFQLHGVSPRAYDQAMEIIAPALLKERDKGKLRFLGVTEAGSSDPEHAMAERAVEDGVWDVVMIAFHMMHQNARVKVFPRTIANRVGTLLMFAVRNIFSRPERLAAALRELTAKGELPRWLADAPNPLGFLLHEGGARTIPEAAYRFVRHEPGVDVVLLGTGDPAHLRANIASILAPPLPLADRQTLTKLFGRLVGVGLDPPYSMPGIPAG
ncbi:MAG: aldo/keto reductase [Alphaproteobacteria bacterium]|nr:aldo/keto reductase [Alphaproteobacteria bacterium]